MGDPQSQATNANEVIAPGWVNFWIDGPLSFWLAQNASCDRISGPGSVPYQRPSRSGRRMVRAAARFPVQSPLRYTGASVRFLLRQPWTPVSHRKEFLGTSANEPAQNFPTEPMDNATLARISTLERRQRLPLVTVVPALGGLGAVAVHRPPLRMSQP